jgi:hypothetical protein
MPGRRVLPHSCGASRRQSLARAPRDNFQLPGLLALAAAKCSAAVSADFSSPSRGMNPFRSPPLFFDRSGLGWRRRRGQ